MGLGMGAGCWEMADGVFRLVGGRLEGVAARPLPMRSIPLILTCLLALCFAPAGFGQADVSLEKLQAYLERNPYHERTFARWTHEAQERGVQGELVVGLEALLLERPGEEALVVLLARLEAHLGRPAEALARLGTLEAESAGLWQLRGDLQVRLGAFEEACEDLLKAAQAFEDRRLAGDAWVELGRTRMRLGDRQSAVAAFEAFAELDPGSFGQCFEAAALLEEVGLEEPALQALERALALATDDPASIVRVLDMRGRVLEGFGHAAVAEEAYGEAMDLLGPGHWQREELFERRLHLRRGLGNLPEWIESMRRRVARNADGQLRGFLARALLEYGDPAGALEVLEEGARSFPGDLTRGVEYAQALTNGERGAEAVAEYRRLAALHPGELGLHREAGLLLAGMGSMEEAQGHWTQELARAPKSIELHLDLARMQAQLGARGEQERLLKAAWELEPGDLRALRALLAARRQAGRSSSQARLLTEAQHRALAAGEPSALEEIAQEWIAIDQPSGALRALEMALEAGGNPYRILGQLAPLHEIDGKPRKALAAWRRRFPMSKQPRERVEMAWSIGRLRHATQSTNQITRELRRELLENERSTSECVLLVCALAQAKPPGSWLEVILEEHASGGPSQELFLTQARVAEAVGDPSFAAYSLGEIVKADLKERVRLLPEIARLHRDAGEMDKALRAEEALLALAPSRPSLIVELAEAELRDKDYPAARELYEQALLEKPGDGQLLLTVLNLEVRAGNAAAVGARLAGLLRRPDETMRREARTWAREVWSSKVYLHAQSKALREKLQVDPRDCDSGLLLVLVHSYLHEPFAASLVLEELLRRYPRESALLELRDELRGLVPGGAQAPWGPGALDEDESLARNLLRRGQVNQARAVFARIADPVRVADIALEAGVPREGLRVLRRLEQSEDSAGAELLLRLAMAYLAAGQESSGMRYAERAAKAWESPWELSLWIARRYSESGRTSAIRSIGEILIADLCAAGTQRDAAWSLSLAEVGELYASLGQRRLFEANLERRCFGSMVDERLFETLLASLSVSQPGRIPVLIGRARRQGGYSDYHLDEWLDRFVGED